MDEVTFRERLRSDGYPEPQVKEYPANLDSDMHTHDASVRLLVTAGKLCVKLDSGTVAIGPGEVFDLAAGVAHAEQTGAEGARALVAKS